MPLSVILRDERGRLSVARSATGQVEFSSERTAENEASRMRFRDDHALYCVYTGIFRNMDEVKLFVQLCNKGLSIERTMRHIRKNP